MGGYIDLCEFLLGHPDVELHSKDLNGQTPLFYAAEGRHTDLCKVFVKHSTDIELNYKDKYGQTILSHAAV
jgi:ankyrin repeat protein